MARVHLAVASISKLIRWGDEDKMAAEVVTQADAIELHSNATLVREQDGSLSIWVGSEKMLGPVQCNITSNGFLGIAVPMSHVRLAERVPATPVVVIANNVLPFTRPDTSAPLLTDGDSR